jgi:hypothetical protein
MWEFYTPKIQILEFFPNTEEGWEEANRVEKRLIKNDLNNPFCLNENCGGCISLSCRSEGGKKAAEKTNEEKDENGKSVNAVKGGNKVHEAKDENGKSLHTLNLHKEKDEDGKSVNAVKAAEKTHEKKDENGKSLVAVKAGNKTHEAKDENGKSLAAVKGGKKGGKKTAAQIWESTIDGFRGSAGNVAYHNKANGWDPNARIRIS